MSEDSDHIRKGTFSIKISGGATNMRQLLHNTVSWYHVFQKGKFLFISFP